MGLKLYPSNMQRMLNKERSSRFKQGLSAPKLSNRKNSCAGRVRELMPCLLRSNQPNYFPEPKMICMLSLPSVCSPLSSNPALWHSVKISKKYYVYIESRNPILSLNCRGKRKLTNSSRIHCVSQREGGEEKNGSVRTAEQ